MPKEDNVLDEFAQDFPSADQMQNEDPDFLTPKPEGQQQTIDAPEGGEGKPNRHHRRISAKLEEERQALQEVREANIREAGRLEGLSEQRKFLEGLPNQPIDERLITLFGADENGKKAAQITQSLLEDTAKRARAEALEDFQTSQREAANLVRQNSVFIDSQLEELEDESGVDLTSDSPAGRKNRTEFLDMWEKFSPKGEDGLIQEYADANEVFNVFKETRKSGTNAPNKALASRGMARGGPTNQSLGDKTTEAYLRNAGII